MEAFVEDFVEKLLSQQVREEADAEMTEAAIADYSEDFVE